MGDAFAHMFTLFIILLGEGSHAPYSTASLTSVIGLLGLKDLDLREDGSEAAVRLHGLLTGD